MHEKRRGRPEREGLHGLSFHRDGVVAADDTMQPQSVEVNHAGGTRERVRKKRKIDGPGGI